MYNTVLERGFIRTAARFVMERGRVSFLAFSLSEDRISN